MELADMQDLGSCAARRMGSSPIFRIKPYTQDPLPVGDGFGVLFFALTVMKIPISATG